MFQLLLKIIPLDLAATLSPGILAVTLVLLGGKIHSKIRTISFLSGLLIVGIIVAILGFALGKVAPSGIGQNLTISIIDLILGGFFIIFGIHLITSRERKIEISQEDDPKILKWIIAGLILSATNFDALFLSLTAAREVGLSAINDLSKILLLVINLVFFALPILLPLFLYLIAPEFAQPFLEKINRFLIKYSRYLLFAMFIIFGTILIFRGIKYFI